jgi:hypothetical protein
MSILEKTAPKRAIPASVRGVCLGILCLLAPLRAQAFALLGPFAPWMTTNLMYGYPGDIGGPMDLGEGYRWNLPTVTYGFDASFLNYFGQPGVQAVENAIQVFNDLPPASDLVLTNFPLGTLRQNYRARSQCLLDLKSWTLWLLLEQLGLTDPVRYLWTFRHWDPILTQDSYCMCLTVCFPEITNYVVLRNFDPVSEQPSAMLNGIFYSHYVQNYTSDCTVLGTVVNSADAYATIYLPVAANWPQNGDFFTGLTRDDAGGLRYLFAKTNVKVESLDDSVKPAGDPASFVRTAPRPGLEKITFLRHATDEPGRFLAMTNWFDDLYFTNGVVTTQRVQRVVTQPDFLFSAKDFGITLSVSENGYGPDYGVWCGKWFERTGTDGWARNQDLNGRPGGDGPGVIRPPVRITFHNPSAYIAAVGSINSMRFSTLYNWATFDGTTNLPHVFTGTPTGATSFTLSMSLSLTNGAPMLDWMLLGRYRSVYRIEASPDLTHWTTNSVVTNRLDVFKCSFPAGGRQEYFRAVLEN